VVDVWRLQWQVVPNKNKVFPTLDPHLVGRGIVNIVEKGLAKKGFLDSG
jgi:hypothetical protein